MNHRYAMPLLLQTVFFCFLPMPQVYQSIMLFHCPLLRSTLYVWLFCEGPPQKYIQWVWTLWLHWLCLISKTRPHNSAIVFYSGLPKNTGCQRGISLTLHPSCSHTNTSVMTCVTQRQPVDTKNKRVTTDKEEGTTDRPLHGIPMLCDMNCYFRHFPSYLWLFIYWMHKKQSIRISSLVIWLCSGSLKRLP